MKTHFRNQTCSTCGKSYDGLGASCPHCGEKSADPSLRKFANFLPSSWPRQLLFFFIGWAGFQIISLLVSSIDLLIAKATNPSWGTAELEAYTKTVGYASLVNFIAYGILLAVMCLVLWKGWKPLLASFKNWKAPLIGLATFVVNFIVANLYSILASVIVKAMDIPFSPNQNESTLRSIIALYPVLSIIIFGFVGPFCEELAYRVGLFSFMGRISKVAAYALSALVFGLIHFSWTTLGTNDAIIELINLPTYIIGGIVLGIAYDFGGFPASYTAHVLNNVLSIALTMSGAQNG